MVILFATTKLEKEFNKEKLLIKTFGDKRAKLLKRRLSEFAAANALQDLRNLPQARCHELKGNLKGCLSVDLDQPYRLIFKPAHNPSPRKSDGGLDWERVTEIIIIGIENTHE